MKSKIKQSIAALRITQSDAVNIIRHNLSSKDFSLFHEMLPFEEFAKEYEDLDKNEILKSLWICEKNRKGAKLYFENKENYLIDFTADQIISKYKAELRLKRAKERFKESAITIIGLSVVCVLLVIALAIAVII